MRRLSTTTQKDARSCAWHHGILFQGQSLILCAGQFRPIKAPGRTGPCCSCCSGGCLRGKGSWRRLHEQGQAVSRAVLILDKGQVASCSQAKPALQEGSMLLSVWVSEMLWFSLPNDLYPSQSYWSLYCPSLYSYRHHMYIYIFYLSLSLHMSYYIYISVLYTRVMTHVCIIRYICILHSFKVRIGVAFIIFCFIPTYMYVLYTLWLFNIAMENCPFIDDFPINTSI